MAQNCELILNGHVFPASRYAGKILPNHTITTNESMQLFDYQKIQEFFLKQNEHNMNTIYSEFWQAIGIINWPKVKPADIVNKIPQLIVNKIRLRLITYTMKLTAIQYLTKQHMENLRIAVSEIEEFKEMDLNDQNMLLSHIVGSGDGIYSMMIQMPEMIVPLIQKKLYGNFMDYIGLSMQDKVVIDLDAKLAEYEKSKHPIVEAPAALEPEEAPLEGVDALSESEGEPEHYSSEYAEDEAYEEEYEET